MKHVGTHPTHIEASKTLADLSAALVAAQAEVNEVQTLLVQTKPSQPAGALERAKSMLSGAPEPQRADLAGLQQRLVVATGKVTLLTDAVNEQRQVLAALVDAESALATIAAKPKHIKAVEGIKQALDSLKATMASEASIHAEIEAAGLRSGLVPMTRPALNPINPDSSLAQFAHDIEAHLAQHALQSTPQVNVHILAAGQHGLPGDVVQMTGAEAAQLLALGHCEVTAAKPHRVPRLKSWQSQETVLS